MDHTAAVGEGVEDNEEVEPGVEGGGRTVQLARLAMPLVTLYI